MNDVPTCDSRARETKRSAGGKARARALPAIRRSDIAKKGAAVRWDPHIRTARFGDEDHPLVLGDTKIACYILDNEERVLSQRGLFEALGLRSSGSAMERFIRQTNLDRYLSEDALVELRSPLKMRAPHGGAFAYTYRGPLLVDVCNALLSSRDQGAVENKAYQAAVLRAYVIVRAVAKVGIIALIDEATGYEKQRATNSLAQILEAFIAKELQPWVKTFPAEYYSELFRLRGLSFPDGKVQRPSYFGYLTNDIVYRRLAPFVLDELKQAVPKMRKANQKVSFFKC